MYGLPEDFDSSIFHDKRLISVTFAGFGVAFAFAPDLMIQTEWGFNYSLGADSWIGFQSVPPTESGVIRLLGLTVSGADAQTDGTLTIVFQDGSRLQFVDSGPLYEAYEISTASRRIIV